MFAYGSKAFLQKVTSKLIELANFWLVKLDIKVRRNTMQLDELKMIIQGAGGRQFALEYAEALLGKIIQIESNDSYEKLINQLRVAKEQGDFRGRVLEVNFASLFAGKGVGLQYGAKQGMSGDVDFCWRLGDYQFFIEMKLLGQDQKTRESINQQLKDTGFSSTLITEDTWDIARIQRDIFQKSSTKKFNPQPEQTWINLVAIDVSELQLGTIDMRDCLLAALGNEGASKYCHPACLRPSVVGVFQPDEVSTFQGEQINWVRGFHKTLYGGKHPRNYIHGVLFLFREPWERAALCYELSAAVVWNPALYNTNVASIFCKSFQAIVPCKK